MIRPTAASGRFSQTEPSLTTIVISGRPRLPLSYLVGGFGPGGGQAQTKGLSGQLAWARRDVSRSATMMELSEHLSRIAQGRHEAPDICLGVHTNGGTAYFRIYLPNASVSSCSNNEMLYSVDGTDIYQWIGQRDQLSAHPQVTWTDEHGQQHTEFYSFKPSIEPFDLHCRHC